MRKWDELNLKRKVVGIGGVDAHAHKTNFLGFFEVEVFPYKVLFKSIRTHILSSEKIEKGKDSGSLKAAKKIIYEGLKSGNCFFSNYYHGDARGFRFFAEDGSKIYQMGDKVELNNQIKLRIFLPNISGQVHLVHNGRTVDTVENIDAEFVIKRKGVYRVEVYLDNNAWIFSNHIRIGI